jgi:hypothetical protein
MNLRRIFDRTHLVLASGAARNTTVTGIALAVIFLPLTKYSQAFENKPIRLLSAETGRGFGAWREDIRLLKHRRTTNAYDSN